MSGSRKKLVIKVMSGLSDKERTAQAFTVAATALVSGVEVSLWLTGDASDFALPGRAEQFELPHAAPLQDLLAAVIAGGSVTLCTQCAQRRASLLKELPRLWRRLWKRAFRRSFTSFYSAATITSCVAGTPSTIRTSVTGVVRRITASAIGPNS